MPETIISTLRNTVPLVHCMTNYVTVNDCANALLAIGGSPVMADDAGEVEEITSISTALVLNIGTLNQRTIESMLLAGKKANELGKPVVFDPVGAGASRLRTETALRFLREIRFAAIRGNASEVAVLATGQGETRGVDASDSADLALRTAQEFSKKTGAVVAITGATDIITNGEKTALVQNGVPQMGKITGTGCMLSAISGAFIACGNAFETTTAAVAVMGICGERAYERAKSLGTGSMRTFLIDELSCMSDEILAKGARISYG